MLQANPLIIFAFAHERSESNPPVRNLLKEQLQVTSLVAPLVQQKFCETQAFVNISVDRLNEIIDREGPRLIGLHYASDVATLLRVREGKDKSMDRALKGKLGRRLGALPHLKWVFLSGDGSQEQSESLIKSGVPLVVRSQNLINDDAAFRLAYFFYQAIGQGSSLGKACESSVAEVRRDYVNKAKLTYEHEPPSGYGSDWPFGYQVNPYLASPLWWSVPHATHQAGVGLPRPQETDLPEMPFTDFGPLDERYAALIHGKDLEARTIYEILTSAQAPAVVLVTGAKKNGKSSFLRARLGPILSSAYQVRYAEFRSDTLTTLAHALSSDEDLSLVRTWVELEGGRERTLLQPQMITELMSEAQSSFRSHYRSDRADFTQFLKAIRAMWMRDELGEGENLILRLGTLFDQQNKVHQDESEETAIDVRPLVVMLDQLEKTFEVETSMEKRRQDRFWEIVHQLTSDPDRPFRGGLILCVDSSEESRFSKMLHQNHISFETVSLPALTRGDLSQYLDRFRTNPKVKEHFPLMVDEQVPQLMGQLLEGTDPTRLGYRFHALLRDIWTEQSRRPLLLNQDLISKSFTTGSSLHDLLLKRVRRFLELMKAQGDEVLNEQLALDLLYRMCVFAKKTLEVSSFLEDYLQWGEDLPYPWAERQKSLGDQSLWVLTQAIDLGLFKGKIKAGLALPSGELELLHADLIDVLKEEWSNKLSVFERAIERLNDYAKTGLPAPLEDVELAKRGFQVMRLPTPFEAQLLSTGVQLQEEKVARARVQTKMGRLTQWGLGAGLILVMARCAQLGGSLDELEETRSGVQDQLRMLAAERAFDHGERDIAASLLKEVREPSLNTSWGEMALKSLSKPIAIDRTTAQQLWKTSSITPLAYAMRNSDGHIILWSGQPKIASHQLGSPSKLDHDLTGQHWVSFDSGTLFFWSLDENKPLTKRLQNHEIQDLLLNHEGTIATVLDQSGVASLYRSYDYPVKELRGLGASPITRISFNSGKTDLLLLDQAGGIQSFAVSQERIGLTVPAPLDMELIDAKWVGGLRPSVVGLYRTKNKSGYHLIHYEIGREPQTLYQSRSKVSHLMTSPFNSQLTVEVLDPDLNQSSSRGRAMISLMVIELNEDSSVSSASFQADQPESVIFDPKAEHMVVQTQRTPHEAQLFALRSRTTPVTLKTVSQAPLSSLRFTPDGRSIIALNERETVLWSVDTGLQRSEYRRDGFRPLAFEVFGDQLHVAHADLKGRQRGEVTAWSLEQSPLGQSLTHDGQEIAQLLWAENTSGSGNDFVTGNQKGEVTIWSGEARQSRVHFKGHQDQVTAIQLSSDKQHFFTGAMDGSLASWSLVDGRAVSRFEGHQSAITTISSPSRPAVGLFVSGDKGGVIWQWNQEANSGVQWRAHQTRIRALNLSPAARWLVSIPANHEEKGALWKMREDTPAQLIAQLPNGIRATRWLNESNGDQSVLLLNRDGALFSWSSGGGAIKQIGSLSSHLNGAHIVSAEIRADGQKVIFVHSSGEASLYSRPHNRFEILTPPTGRLTVAQFMREDTSQSPEIMMGADDGRIWLWSSGQWMNMGDHQGPITHLTQSKIDGSILSLSENLAQHWRGPFNLETLSGNLRSRVILCLKPEERIHYLAETKEVAQEEAARCTQVIQ